MQRVTFDDIKAAVLACTRARNLEEARVRGHELWVLTIAWCKQT